MVVIQFLYSFGSRIGSVTNSGLLFILNADNTYNAEPTNRKWGTVYATTFNGDFQGTADNADKLTMPKNIHFR